MAERLTCKELEAIFAWHRERPSTQPWCKAGHDNWPCEVERLRLHIDALEERYQEAIKALWFYCDPVSYMTWIHYPQTKAKVLIDNGKIARDALIELGEIKDGG